MAPEGKRLGDVHPVSAKLTAAQTRRLQTLRRIGLVNTDTAAFTRQCVDKGIEALLREHSLSIFTLDRLGEDESLSVKDAAWQTEHGKQPEHGKRRAD